MAINNTEEIYGTFHRKQSIAIKIWEFSYGILIRNVKNDMNHIGFNL